MNCLFYSPWIVKSPFYSSWNVIWVIYFLFWNVKCRIYCPLKCETANLYSMKSDQYPHPPPPLYLPQRTNIKSTNTICYTQWRIQRRGPGVPPPRLIFRPNWGPKGREIFFLARPPPHSSPPLCQGLDYRAPPLSEGLDPPLIQTSKNTSKTL